MKKIYLLDDNAEMIEIAKMVLEKEYIIKGVTDADTITDDLRSFKPDLLLIDHFIGQNNSSDIMAEIRNAIPGFSIPIILFSASHDVAERALAMGAAGYIEKPASIRYIKDYIQSFFNAEN